MTVYTMGVPDEVKAQVAKGVYRVVGGVVRNQKGRIVAIMQEVAKENAGQVFQAVAGKGAQVVWEHAVGGAASWHPATAVAFKAIDICMKQQKILKNTATIIKQNTEILAKVQHIQQHRLSVKPDRRSLT